MQVPRKSPAKRLFQEDEYDKFLTMDVIKSFDSITEKMLPDGYVMQRYAEHLVMYEMTMTEEGAPVIQSCIRIDNDLRVKLFYRGSPLPLPEWFRKGRDCRLTRCSMLENLFNYVKVEGEQTSDIFSELRKISFQKKPRFSPSVIRYALLLRYTSVQAYKVVATEFPFPSL